MQIVKMGHPTLRRVADPIADPTAPEVAALARSMIAAMDAAPGVGLAAPQVAVARRLIVFRVPDGRRMADEPAGPIDPVVLINPEIHPLDARVGWAWEGCLSIPGLTGRVPRWHRIGYRGLDLTGAVVERDVVGFHARVVQHEVDHLDGVLYMDRMPSLHDLIFDDQRAIARPQTAAPTGTAAGGVGTAVTGAGAVAVDTGVAGSPPVTEATHGR